MSIDLEFVSAPFLGKRKETDQEESIGGQSKKATSMRKEGDHKEKEGDHKENEGDHKENEGKEELCQICWSKGHSSYDCSWTLGIPPDVVPKPGPNWMVVCFCGNRKILDQVKVCPQCGGHDRYVKKKKCCACRGRGHLDNFDSACMYFGKTGEDDPFYLFIKRILERHGFDPLTCLENPPSQVL